LFLLLLSQVWLIQATPWLGPSPTVAAMYTGPAESTMRPTPAPELNLGFLRRARSTTSWSGWGEEICGWENGEYSSAFSCYNTDTCLWNSHNSVVGCGNTAVVPHFTTCVDFNTTSCDRTCSANPNILKCGSSSEYCYIAEFPNGYSMQACGYTANVSVTVDTVYGGLPTPIFLPRYLGSDNILTVETQLPNGQKTTMISSVAVSSSQPGSPNAEMPAKKSIVGPVVGGVLGGVALFVALGAGLALFLRRRRKAFVNGEVRKVQNEVVQSASPHELSGRPKPLVEIG